MGATVDGMKEAGFALANEAWAKDELDWTGRERLLGAFASLYSQVWNGGFEQWRDNGYSRREQAEVRKLVELAAEVPSSSFGVFMDRVKHAGPLLERTDPRNAKWQNRWGDFDQESFDAGTAADTAKLDEWVSDCYRLDADAIWTGMLDALGLFEAATEARARKTVKEQMEALVKVVGA